VIRAGYALLRRCTMGIVQPYSRREDLAVEQVCLLRHICLPGKPLSFASPCRKEGEDLRAKQVRVRLW
jgi:hypothetical protein